MFKFKSFWRNNDVHIDEITQVWALCGSNIFVFIGECLRFYLSIIILIEWKIEQKLVTITTGWYWLYLRNLISGPVYELAFLDNPHRRKVLYLGVWPGWKLVSYMVCDCFDNNRLGYVHNTLYRANKIIEIVDPVSCK